MTPSDPLPVAFALLGDLENPAVDVALVEALPRLDPPAAAAALDLLVVRDDPTALAGVVGRFASYSDGTQAQILARIPGFHAGLRVALQSGSLEPRLGAVSVIARSGTCKLAYLLSDALKASCVRTREAAAGALHAMTTAWLTAPHAIGPDTCEAADDLAEALGAGVLAWEIHHQPKVLEAAAWMAGRTIGAIRRKLDERRTKIGRAFGDLIAGTSDPALAGFALHALTFRTLRTAAAHAIASARNPDFIHAIVRESWMLADPRVRNGCRRIRQCQWLHGDPGILLEMTPCETARGVRLLAATGGFPETKVRQYERLLASDDDEVRRAVLWALVDDASETAATLLRVLAARAGDPLSNAARRELDRRVGKPRTDSIANQAHASDTSGAELRRNFELCWRRFEQAGGRERTVEQGERPVEERERLELFDTLKGVPTQVAVLLRARLASSRASERTQALRFAGALGVLRHVDAQVRRLAHDPDHLVRCVAVAMLGELPPDAATLRVLRTAADDPDPRVQAGAVEALDRLDCADRIAITDSKLNSPHSRVRANAIKSLLRVELPKAGDALLDMLEDRSSAHRLSALWVVQRLGLSSLSDRVTQMSGRDQDRRVRQRAACVASEWQSRATTDAPPARSETPIRALTLGR